MILLNQFKKIDKQKLIMGFLLSFVFVFNFMLAFWIIQWLLNNSGEFFYEKAVASISDNSQPKILPDLYKNPVSSQQVNSQNEIENYSQREVFNIDAESVISVKIQDGQESILLSKNEKEKLPIASLTKLMTALVVLEKYDLDQKVVVSDSAMAQEGEQGVLKAGEVLSVKNLLYISLIESSNRAAFALSEIMGPDKFIALMNETGQRIGLTNTNFQDSTGLDPASYSTSEDLVKLTRYLFENYSLFREIISYKEFDLYLPNGQFHHKLENTNKFLNQVQGVIGGKTGWTNFSKGCFMVIQEDPQNKNYLIYIILGAQDRFLEMENLINWIDSNYKTDLFFDDIFYEN